MRFEMCATHAFLRSLGAKIHVPGHQRWPEKVQARTILGGLPPLSGSACVSVHDGRAIRTMTHDYSSRMLMRIASASGSTRYVKTVRSPVFMITSTGMPAVIRARIVSGIVSSSMDMRAR